MEILLITVIYSNDITGNKIVHIVPNNGHGGINETIEVNGWSTCHDEIAELYDLEFIGRVANNTDEKKHQLIFKNKL